jgi:hypothetical protein
MAPAANQVELNPFHQQAESVAFMRDRRMHSGVPYISAIQVAKRTNPKIIYASIKAFGEPNAYPSLKGMDIIVQALSRCAAHCSADH